MWCWRRKTADGWEALRGMSRTLQPREWDTVRTSGSYGVETAETTMGEEAPPGLIFTTLYDLVEAVQASVTPDEEDLVVTIIVSIMRSGRITFLSAAASQHLTV